MAVLDLAGRIGERASAYGVRPAPVVSDGLVRYLGLLSRWNRRINLTALPLDPVTDATIDRLIVEALVAAAQLPPGTRRLLDIGSGAGSPAIPMKMARPDLALTMIEARSRKSAFLREAGRTLGLKATTVDTCRFGGDGHTPKYENQFDVVTIRAVATGDQLLQQIGQTLLRGGKLFLFSAVPPEQPPTLQGWRCTATVPLPAGTMAVMQRG